MAELVDIPVPPGRGAGGGLHEFSPGQVATASASLPRSAHEAVDVVFRTFPGVKKVRGPAASAEITRKVIFHQAGSSRTPAHGVRRLMAMALCWVRMTARGTSSRTVTRRRRKKSLRCSTSLSTGSNSLAGDPDASAVTTWQAAVHAGWGCTFAHGEQELHPYTLPGALRGRACAAEHVRRRWRGEEGRRRRWRRSGCSCAPDAAPWHCRGPLIKRWRRRHAGFGGSMVGGGFPRRGRGSSHR